MTRQTDTDIPGIPGHKSSKIRKKMPGGLEFSATPAYPCICFESCHRLGTNEEVTEVLFLNEILAAWQPSKNTLVLK